jgi:polysaccharide export outer membrane protein
LSWVGLAAIAAAAPPSKAASEASPPPQPAWAGPTPPAGAAGTPQAAIPAGSAVSLAVPAGAAGSLTASDYRITRGDELSLRFYYTPELNTNAGVRSDGRISVPLLGEVHVEGMTVADMSALIERLLAPQVKRAQVSINVQTAATQRVFVGGEVTKPGMQPLAGPMTVLQAVMVAEGMKDTAQPAHVLLLRRGPQGQREVLTIDLDAVMSGRDLSGDLPLQAFDAIVVPRTGIADVGRWVDLYIRRVLPISFGFNYTIDRNGTTR